MHGRNPTRDELLPIWEITRQIHVLSKKRADLVDELAVTCEVPPGLGLDSIKGIWGEALPDGRLQPVQFK